MGDRFSDSARSLTGVGVTRLVVGQGHTVPSTPMDLVETGVSASNEAWGERLLQRLAETQTHAVLEDGCGRVMGRRRHEQLAADVGFLEAHGVVVAQCFTGGDLLKSLSEGPPSDALAVSNWLGLPQFVSSPEMLAVLPRAKWLPGIHTEEIAWDRVVLSEPRPVVMQLLPQSVNGEYGGGPTDLSQLHEDGLIDLWALSGVPESLLPALFRRADIVVDHSGTGPYGAISRLSLGAGCLTLVPLGSMTGPQPAPPVIDVSNDPIAELVRDIVERPDAYRPVAEAGPRYVKRWHDGRESARVMAEFLGLAIEEVTM